jgi:hypothetical protein
MQERELLGKYEEQLLTLLPILMKADANATLNFPMELHEDRQCTRIRLYSAAVNTAYIASLRYGERGETDRASEMTALALGLIVQLGRGPDMQEKAIAMRRLIQLESDVLSPMATELALSQHSGTLMDVLNAISNQTHVLNAGNALVWRSELDAGLLRTRPESLDDTLGRSRLRGHSAARCADELEETLLAVHGAWAESLAEGRSESQLEDLLSQVKARLQQLSDACPAILVEDVGEFVRLEAQAHSAVDRAVEALVGRSDPD